MKKLFTIISIALLSTSVLSQSEIKLSEEIQSFALGSKNCIVVNIPYGNKDIVEKELKSEMKDWGGKYNSSGNEFFTVQSTVKFMGDKPFDAVVKIISTEENNFKIAFAIDLGGAYMNSREHRDQFSAMSERIKKFAKETAVKCVEKQHETNTDFLSDMEKVQRNLEKDKKDLEEDIQSYKKKIAEAEQKIKENDQTQEKQKEAIKAQKLKVSESETKLKSLK